MKNKLHIFSLISLLIVSCSFFGCVETQKKTIKLGDFVQKDDPIIFGGNQESIAETYNNSEQDLNEVQWKILEQYAPKSFWKKIREKNQNVIKARKQSIVFKAAKSLSKVKEIKPIDALIEKLPNNKVQIYYNVRHFGGMVVKANAKEGLQRRSITMTPSDLKPLIELVKIRLGNKGTVNHLAVENKLIIICDEDIKNSVLMLLAYIDVPTPQVEVSARIFEVKHNMDFQAGVRLLLNHLGSAGTQQGFGTVFSAEDFAGAVTDPLAGKIPDPGAAMRILNVFGSSGWSLDSTIQAMESTGMIKMVARPSLTVAANKTAYFLAGERRPIANARFTGDNLVTEKTTYEPIGVQLTITPEVISSDMIKLHVIVIVSSVSGFQAMSGLTGATAPVLNPIIDTREAETTVTIKNGTTLVIGGLRQTNTIVAENKLPLLGNIPYLGWLFKSHRSQERITDLYFFLTPKIVNTEFGS